jgi:hypothetical protein
VHPSWTYRGISGDRLGIVTELIGPIEAIENKNLTDALRGVVSHGLPVHDRDAGDLLPNLRSVYARAVVPSERRSRLTALNELLPRLIATMSDARYRDAEQVLFGLAPGTRGSLLTARRRQAAKLLDYSEEHFRDRIEGQLLEATAVALQDDLMRYRSRIKRSVESLEPTGDTPRLGPEHLTHEEELISRIWQHVYGLRAELIAHARLSEAEGHEAQAEDHRQAAILVEQQLNELLTEYEDTYGESLIRHGDTEYNVEALERLAGWQL